MPPCSSRLREDIAVVFDRDPAARTRWEVLTCYPGLHAPGLAPLGVPSAVAAGLRWLARWLAHWGRCLTGSKSIRARRSGGGFSSTTGWESSSAKRPKSPTIAPSITA